MNILIGFLTVVLVLVCLLIVLVVLMQRPKQEGLGAAFGASMTNQVFGSQTTDVLQKITVWLGVLFFILTLFISMLISSQSRGTNQDAINAGLTAKEEASEDEANLDLPGLGDQAANPVKLEVSGDANEGGNADENATDPVTLEVDGGNATGNSEEATSEPIVVDPSTATPDPVPVENN